MSTRMKKDDLYNKILNKCDCGVDKDDDVHPIVLKILGGICRVPAKVWWLIGFSVAGVVLAIRNRNNGDYCAFHYFLDPHPVQLQMHPTLLPLARKTFGAQDIFDVKEYVTGFGSPDWERTHDKARKTSVAIEQLIKAGATCIGKTVMDELGFSLIGKNRHYGTPQNPAALDRVCGGSSSGAAVAVAGNLVDFSIGIDTVGDIRIPAAYCGILGFRSSQGAISSIGVTPVASSLDAVGWYSKDPALLRLVGHAMLQHAVVDMRGPKRFYIAHDVFKLSTLPQVRTADVVARAVQRILGRHTLHPIDFMEHLAHYTPSVQTFINEIDKWGSDVSKYTTFDVFRECMLTIQRYEFEGNHGQWIRNTQPVLTKEVDARVTKAIEHAKSNTLKQIAQKVKEESRTVMNNLLKNEAVLVIPSTPGYPPKLSLSSLEMDLFEYRAHTLMSIASVSGCCQVVIPVGKAMGLPMSVSLVARNGADHLLLDTMMLLYRTIQQEVQSTEDTLVAKVEANMAALYGGFSRFGNDKKRERMTSHQSAPLSKIQQSDRKSRFLTK